MPEIVKDEAAQKLRQQLHERIDRLPASTLPAAERLLLQVEVSQLRQELDAAFDQDRRESRMSPQKMEGAIALHHARHPYKG